MTRGEARKKYETKFFFMVITERVDHADNDLGYVIYTANTRRELQNAPMDDYDDLFQLGYDMDWICKNVVVFADKDKPVVASGR